MTNYYEILGLSPDAGIREIKAAFRQLAKIYHPDKNPEGQEIFTKILKAYETLSNPRLKTSYDHKLNYKQPHSGHHQTKNPDTKQWRFDEREMRRRQYYNEHIKKYAKTYATGSEAQIKSTYNEFKYIMFATPLAVGLFLLIMKLATPESPTLNNDNAENNITSAPISVKTSDLKTGDAPYSGYFANPIYDTIADQKLSVKNLTGRDIIVCLFAKKTFVRSFFISESLTGQITQLPDEALQIRYSSGLDFDYHYELKEVGISGAFIRQLYFYKGLKEITLGAINELTLMPGLNKGFVETDEKGFFESSH